MKAISKTGLHAMAPSKKSSKAPTKHQMLYGKLVLIKKHLWPKYPKLVFRTQANAQGRRFGPLVGVLLTQVKTQTRPSISDQKFGHSIIGVQVPLQDLGFFWPLNRNLGTRAVFSRPRGCGKPQVADYDDLGSGLLGG